jgi:UTP--glucose-1-phosphate uridylyltransferase
MSEDVSRYGVADIDFTHSYPIARGVVEKPLPGKEPSRYIVVGRYLLNEACVAALQEVESATQTGEVFLTAALNDTAHQGNLAAHILEGERLDIGTPSGYLKSQLRIACG